VTGEIDFDGIKPDIADIGVYITDHCVFHDVTSPKYLTVEGIVVEVVNNIPSITKPVSGPAPWSKLPKDLWIQFQAKNMAGMCQMLTSTPEKLRGCMVSKST